MESIVEEDIKARKSDTTILAVIRLSKRHYMRQLR